MGFMDNVTSVVNRGTASVQRTGRSAQLKMQLNDLMKRRRELAAQLGASLYEDTKEMEQLRQGREALFDGIADIDAQRAQVQSELDQLENKAVAQQVAATTYRCPRCGTGVPATDFFCSGCGLPIAEVAQQANQAPAAPDSGIACAKCGAPMAEDDVFCMACGNKREETPSLDTSQCPEG